MPDNTAVDNGNHQFIRVGGCHLVQTPEYPFPEGLDGFSARDDIPSLLFVHLLIKGVVFVRLDAKQPAFPLAKMHFPKVGFNPVAYAQMLA